MTTLPERYRSFTIQVEKDSTRKGFSVEWTDGTFTYWPLPKGVRFKTKQAALDKARELIDYQYATEARGALRYFHGIDIHAPHDFRTQGNLSDSTGTL